LALTRPLSERERNNPKTLEAKAAALARQDLRMTAVALSICYGEQS
jgi:hypothetical protein